MATKAESIASTTPTLTQKRIFLYWLPLAASWLLMAVEWPVVTGWMARLSEAERMIAAFGIVSSISLVIESPIISLLPTCTALARNRQSYLTLRKFTLHLMAVTTILHVLMGWTQLFDMVVIDLIGIPDSLYDPSRLGMKIMVFWSLAIAWRRFNQGILIRHGLTRYIGIGTILRLVSSASTVTLLAIFTKIPGIAIGALALEVGVISEAVFAHIMARKTISEKFGVDVIHSDEQELGYVDLVKFHWPLAASNLIFLAARPLVSAALARGLHPENDLAAWPVLSGLFFLTRAPAVAIPEVVIALYDEQEDKKPLSTFTLRVGLSLIGVMALFAFTPLSRLYFEKMIGVSTILADIAIHGVKFAFILPLITATLSYFRGAFTARKNTIPITLAMIVELVTMTVALAIGVILEVPGVPLAAIALTLAMGADNLVLYIATRRKKKGY